MTATTTKKIPIQLATAAQLQVYARKVLGLDLPAGLRQAQLVSKIKAVNPDIKEIDAEDAPVQAVTPAAPAVHVDTNPRMVRVFIPAKDEIGGDRPVPVGVNGVMMLVPRGSPVEIPSAYAEVLANAVEVRIDQIEGPDGMILHIPRDVPRFGASVSF
jgi:hypothetical protein